MSGDFVVLNKQHIIVIDKHLQNGQHMALTDNLNDMTIDENGKTKIRTTSDIVKCITHAILHTR